MFYLYFFLNVFFQYLFSSILCNQNATLLYIMKWSLKSAFYQKASMITFLFQTHTHKTFFLSDVLINNNNNSSSTQAFVILKLSCFCLVSSCLLLHYITRTQSVFLLSNILNSASAYLSNAE